MSEEHQQHLELAANYPKIAVSYTQVATIATDELHTLQESGVGRRQWPILSDPAERSSRTSHRRVHRPDDNPMIPHTLVLKPGLVVHSIYNGNWFWGRRPSTTSGRPARSDE